MILEPFYTENNWTTKNQVLAYQKRFEMQTLTEKYYQEKILFRVNVTNFWFHILENLMSRYRYICMYHFGFESSLGLIFRIINLL